MKGYRFYLEFGSQSAKRKNQHRGTVFAAHVESKPHKSGDQWCQEGAGAVFDAPDSGVCWCAASCEYLRQNCKRISEQEARKIHPRLFQYLEQ